jgi:hypothetical protein
MPWLRFPAVPPALAAAADDRGRMKKRAGLPKLLHKLLVKVLRLRARDEEPMTMSAACYGYWIGAGYDADEDEYCYCYSYGASWAGVLSSIPEEEVDDSSEEEEDGTSPDVAPASVLRKAKSERLVVGPPEDATVVHVEVLL